MVNLYEVRIRRDAHTITPVVTTAYELPVLQFIHGEENVQSIDGKLPALGAVAGSYAPAEDEYGRLAARYGEEAVEAVYGKRAARALEKAVADALVRKTGRGAPAVTGEGGKRDTPAS